MNLMFLVANRFFLLSANAVSQSVLGQTIFAAHVFSPLNIKHKTRALCAGSAHKYSRFCVHSNGGSMGFQQTAIHNAGAARLIDR